MNPPLSFAGDGWAFLGAGLASSWACLEGERTAQATTWRCTFTNEADEADRGQTSGAWDAEVRGDGRVVGVGGRASREVQGAQGLN